MATTELLVNAAGIVGDLAPLHLAAREGREDVAKLLLDGGDDPNAMDKYGITPLHLAAREDREGVAKLLLDKGADIDAKDGDGQTPLHYAKNEGVAKLLLDAGADIDAKDSDGRTPSDVANAKIKDMIVIVRCAREAKELAAASTPEAAEPAKAEGRRRRL